MAVPILTVAIPTAPFGGVVWWW